MEVKKEVNKKKNISISWAIKCYKVKTCESSVSDNCFLKISYLFLI